MLELVKDVNEEIVADAAEVLIEAVPEDVVVEAGMSLGKKAGLALVGVGAVAGTAYGVYKLVKFIKNKKAKNNVEDNDNTAENAESESENEN